jgi:hypothetical protein
LLLSIDGIHLFYDLVSFLKLYGPENNRRLIVYAKDTGSQGYTNDDGDMVPFTWKLHKDIIRSDGYGNWVYALMIIRNIDLLSIQTIPLQPT